MTVGHKKAPSTLVDDCIDKFRQHEVERKRLRLLNGQRGSTDGAPVEFLMGAEGDPLSAALRGSTGDPDVPGVEDVTAGGGKDLMQIYSFAILSYCRLSSSPFWHGTNVQFTIITVATLQVDQSRLHYSYG